MTPDGIMYGGWNASKSAAYAIKGFTASTDEAPHLKQMFPWKLTC
jgi:hypothetical protein